MAALQAPVPGVLQGVGYHRLLQCLKVKSESKVAQSCLTLCDPMDCSPPGSPVHGIFQARVLEWGAIAFSALLSYSLLFFFFFFFSLSLPIILSLGWFLSPSLHSQYISFLRMLL